MVVVSHGSEYNEIYIYIYQKLNVLDKQVREKLSWRESNRV